MEKKNFFDDLTQVLICLSTGTISHIFKGRLGRSGFPYIIGMDYEI
jgi:hypothetical protein